MPGCEYRFSFKVMSDEVIARHQEWSAEFGTQCFLFWDASLTPPPRFNTCSIKQCRHFRPNLRTVLILESWSRSPTLYFTMNLMCALCKRIERKQGGKIWKRHGFPQ